VVLIGEMRDLETIESALRIAETGHLTFARCTRTRRHRPSTGSSTSSRRTNSPQIRAQLSFVLEGILCQALLPRANGHGRVLTMEILVPNARDPKPDPRGQGAPDLSAMQTGQSQFGMQTFNQSLASLYFKKQITLQLALSMSSNPDELQDMINRGAGVISTRSCRLPRQPPRPRVVRRTAGSPAGAGRRRRSRCPITRGRVRPAPARSRRGSWSRTTRTPSSTSFAKQQILVTAVTEKGKEFAFPRWGAGSAGRRSRSSRGSSP